MALDAAVFDDVNMRHAAPLTLSDEPDKIVRDQHRQESGQTVMRKRYQGWMEHAKEIDPNHATWMTVKDQISLTYPTHHGAPYVVEPTRLMIPIQR